MIPREHIAQAVFDLSAPLSASLSPTGPFVTRSRRIIPVTQMQTSQLPALFQMQDNESQIAEWIQLKGDYASLFLYYWIIYAAAPVAVSEPSSPALNDLVDAALSVLPPANVPFVVDDVRMPIGWFQGKVNYIEGIVEGASVAEIPIYVKVPFALPVTP